MLLTFCVTVGVFADAGKTQEVDYKTDYYMIVESPDGGVDMYSEADASSFFFIYILFSLLYTFSVFHCNTPGKTCNHFSHIFPLFYSNSYYSPVMFREVFL